MATKKNLSSVSQNLSTLHVNVVKKPQEVVLLSDEDDMKDPKTVKRKKHVQEADSHTSRSHAVESRAASVVSRMKKDTAPATPVVPETLPSYMDVDVEPKLALTKVGLIANKTGAANSQTIVAIDDQTDFIHHCAATIHNKSRITF
ncbi:hypothetical protein EC991_009831 [Linnemannia zychae]|nr:hypothetical protein EC991_009831 [Linnemannia zychae]